MRLIGVDIGGTKVKAGGVVLGPAGEAPRIIAAEEILTPRLPPSAFYDALAALIRRVQARLGRVPAPMVAVAHPGRFLPNGRLARGTTPNLGTAPGEFDGRSPAAELRRRLGVPVIAENDAVAQMRFGLDRLLRDPAARPRLVGETVVYLGPGTGMGGGVARVSRTGGVRPVTDGHLFDLQVPGIGDGTLTAEELFTGPAIARRVAEANAQLARPIDPPRGGRLDEILADPGAPAEHRAVAERIAEESGRVLACLIRAVCAGRIVKVRLEQTPEGRCLRHVDEPDRAWSAADRDAVRGARRFILGGFIGCSRQLGARIRDRALELLRQEGPSEVAIVQIPGPSADAGLLGVALAAQARRVKKRSSAGPSAR